MRQYRQHSCFRLLSLVTAVILGLSPAVLPSAAYAQSLPLSLAEMPVPGTMVGRTPAYQPLTIKGLRVHPDNPLRFSFIMDTGDSQLDGAALRSEAHRLVRYFLASLTMPENEMWVNLSPYEKDRIITENFGKTEMGRDLLAQDYVLKQLTASLMYPEEQLGSRFWQRVHTKLQAKFGTTDIPVNTFNKVWIVPDKAVVYQHEGSAFVVQSHLKVMLEQDYLAIDQHAGGKGPAAAIHVDVQEEALENSSEVASEMVREVLLPEIEREVNTGENFAALRQIYQSMILASWFKDNLKETLLGKVYVDQVKTRGIETGDEDVNRKIYQQYLQAFEVGVYNYIKEEYDPETAEMIPRKYFSGGITTMNVASVRRDLANLTPVEQDRILAEARRVNPQAQILNVDVDLLGLGKKAGGLLIDKVREAGERGIPIILPQIRDNRGGTDKAVLSDLEKKSAIREYRLEAEPLVRGDAENAEELEVVVAEINEAAQRGDYREVQTLLDYLEFTEFAETTKEFARQESEQVARILRGEAFIDTNGENAQRLRPSPDRYQLALNWERRVSSDAQVLLDQINALLLRENNPEKVRTLLNRLRQVEGLSKSRRDQVTTEIARVNLYIFNREIRRRGRGKPASFAELNYPKLVRAVNAAETALDLEAFEEAGDYRGALERISEANMRAFTSTDQLGGLGAYLMEQDFQARLFDLRRGFLGQLQREFRQQGKALTLRDIVGNGRLLGFDETPGVVALLSEYLNLTNPQRPINVTLSRLAQGYTFPELRNEEVDDETRRQRNRIMIEDAFRLQILPLIGDVVELNIMDEQSARAREDEWMEMLNRDDIVDLILEVDDPDSGTINTETIDILFDKIIRLTHADVPTIMTRFVELGIIERRDARRSNLQYEREQLNNFFYDVRGTLSTRDRALGRSRSEVTAQPLTIQGRDGEQYQVMAIRSKTWASMRRLSPRMDFIRDALTRVMQNPNRDTAYRQNFPAVLRFRQGSERLFLRVFEEEKTIVVLAYGKASIFKKDESGGDLSPDARKHFEPLSSRNLENIEQLKSLYALIPLTVDQAATSQESAPQESKRRDRAVLNANEREVGGIDLNPSLLDLQIRRDPNGIPLPLPQQPVENIQIEGVVPIIIQITPVTNLPLLMGLADTESPVDSAQVPTPVEPVRQQVSLLR